MSATEATVLNLIIETAKTEAATFNSPVVDVEHLLLALTDTPLLTQRRLENQGVTYSRLSHTIQELADEDSANFDPGFSSTKRRFFFKPAGSFSPQVKKIVDSLDLATDDEFKLLQLLLTEHSGKIARLLKGCDVHLDDLREDVGLPEKELTQSHPATPFELVRLFVFFLVFMRLWLGLIQWLFQGASLTSWDTWLSLDRWIAALGFTVLAVLVQVRRGR